MQNIFDAFFGSSTYCAVFLGLGIVLAAGYLIASVLLSGREIDAKFLNMSVASVLLLGISIICLLISSIAYINVLTHI